MRCTVDEEGRVAIPEPLREDLQLEPGSVLEIVEEHGELLLRQVPTAEVFDERAQWLALSEDALKAAYSDSEPEYTLDMIKEPNPDFKDERR